MYCISSALLAASIAGLIHWPLALHVPCDRSRMSLSYGTSPTKATSSLSSTICPRKAFQTATTNPRRKCSVLPKSRRSVCGCTWAKHCSKGLGQQGRRCHPHRSARNVDWKLHHSPAMTASHHADHAVCSERSRALRVPAGTATGCPKVLSHLELASTCSRCWLSSFLRREVQE